MFNIFEEISWPQFAQMSHVAKLPLQEQINQYNQYLFQLEEARTSWIVYQNKGPQGVVNIELLAQQEYDPASEDYFTILQQDGSGIIVTKYID
jgi:hypothetical protein